MNLTPFRHLLRERCGLNFSTEKTLRLESAIDERISRGNFGDSVSYFARIVKDTDEFGRLINLLTVGETYFFREPRHFTIMVTRLVPELQERKKWGEKIGILSAGCSTGEEPYSAALALLEVFGRYQMDGFSLTGIDVNDDAIACARNGMYGHGSFRGANSGEFADKYFTKRAAGVYELDGSVRNTVRFMHGNLLDDSLAKSVGKQDIIFYRNVSIYFNPETQFVILKNLAGMLNDGGYLIVGATETLLHDLSVLTLIEMDEIFFYKKVCDRSVHRGIKDAKDKPCVAADNGESVVPADGGAHGADDGQCDSIQCDNIRSLIKNGRDEDAMGRIEMMIENRRNLKCAYTHKAAILINRDEFGEAEATCRNLLDLDRDCVDAHLLMGRIARYNGDDKRAVTSFRHALELEPTCGMACFFLAELYHANGELELAIEEYGKARRLFENNNLLVDSHLFASMHIDQLAHLCHHNVHILRRYVDHE